MFMVVLPWNIPAVESEDGKVLTELHPLARLRARESFDGVVVIAVACHASTSRTFVARDKVRARD
jgi:hypothetical protein